MIERKNEEMAVAMFLSLCLLLICSCLMYIFEAGAGAGTGTDTDDDAFGGGPFRNMLSSIYVTVPAMIGGGYNDVAIKTNMGKVFSLFVIFSRPKLDSIPLHTVPTHKV